MEQEIEYVVPETQPNLMGKALNDHVVSGIEQNEVGYIAESEDDDETYDVKCELVDINSKCLSLSSVHEDDFWENGQLNNSDIRPITKNIEVVQVHSKLTLPVLPHDDFWDSQPAEDEIGKRTPEQQTLSEKPNDDIAATKNFQCKDCRREFSRADNLRRHIKSAHNEKLIQCNDCKKLFGSAPALKAHVQRIHNATPCFCSYVGCKKNFKNVYGLNQHIKNVHEQEGATYGCDKCPKSFSHKHLLEGHMTHHTGVKKYSCDGCAKKFAYSHNLRAHMKSCKL